MVKRRTLVVSIPIFVLLIIVLGLMALIVAAEATLEPATTSAVVPLGSISDTTLYEENVLRSNGQGQYLFAGATQLVGLRRGLVKFDIAANVPPNALIVSATLKMFVSRHPDPHKPELFTIHRITTQWGEGASDPIDPEGSGATAEEGDATWSLSYFSPTPTERINWHSLGGDFLPTVSAGTTVDEQNNYVTWGPSPGMLADLTHWLRFPENNHGWMLLGNESEKKTARRFNSRQNGDPSTRPTLYVEYTTIQGSLYLPQIVGD